MVIQNNAKIVNDVIRNPGEKIYHDSVNGDNVLIYTNSVVRLLARIGRVDPDLILIISNKVVIPEDTKVEDGVTVRK